MSVAILSHFVIQTKTLLLWSGSDEREWIETMTERERNREKEVGVENQIQKLICFHLSLNHPSILHPVPIAVSLDTCNSTHPIPTHTHTHINTQWSLMEINYRWSLWSVSQWYQSTKTISRFLHLTHTDGKIQNSFILFCPQSRTTVWQIVDICEHLHALRPVSYNMCVWLYLPCAAFG